MYLIWLFHTPHKGKVGTSVKSNRIANFCLDLGSEKLWTWLNVIDHNPVHSWTCKIIIYAPLWLNAPPSTRRSSQTSWSKKITVKEEKKRKKTLFRFDPREHEGKGKRIKWIKLIKIQPIWQIPQERLQREGRKGRITGEMCQRKGRKGRI